MTSFDEYHLKPESDPAALAAAGRVIDTLLRDPMPNLEAAGLVLHRLAFPGRTERLRRDSVFDFAVALTQAALKERVLRTWAPSHPPEGAALPWEYLWVPPHDLDLFRSAGYELREPFLSLHSHCAIVRDHLTPSAPVPPRGLGRLRVLVAWANPCSPDWPGVPAEELARVAVESLKPLEKWVEVMPVSAATPAELLRDIETFQPDVLHYSGHGYFPGHGPTTAPAHPALVLGRAGLAEYLGVDDLAAVCRTEGPRIFVLNCCFGARADLFNQSFAADLFTACGRTSVVVPTSR